jgi:hypothetical protein
LHELFDRSVMRFFIEDAEQKVDRLSPKVVS